jgi:transcriptional regulator with XRE-family HTH domain
VASWPRLRHDFGVASIIDMPGLGKAVAERRKAVGKTQEDLAYESGVSLRHLQKIEAGGTNPRLGTLLTIARILEIKPQRLLDRAEDLQRPRRR